MLIEECARLATLVWLYAGSSLLSHEPPHQNARRAVVINWINLSVKENRLVRILRLPGFLDVDVSDGLSGPSTFVLWILGLSVLAAVDEEEAAWLSKSFIVISTSMGIATYEEFKEKISSRYFWLRLLEQASGSRLQKLYKAHSKDGNLVTVMV